MQESEGDSPAEEWYDSYLDQSGNSTYNLPFIPGYYETQADGSKLFRRFDNMSISLNATHPSNNLTEYDVHSLYGVMMAKRIYEILSNSTGKDTKYPRSDRRPFVLSRSTFASSG